MLKCQNAILCTTIYVTNFKMFVKLCIYKFYQTMGGQRQRSDSADGNKILIITIQATKCY